MWENWKVWRKWKETLSKCKRSPEHVLVFFTSFLICNLWVKSHGYESKPYKWLKGDSGKEVLGRILAQQGYWSSQYALVYGLRIMSMCLWEQENSYSTVISTQQTTDPARQVSNQLIASRAANTITPGICRRNNVLWQINCQLSVNINQ